MGNGAKKLKILQVIQGMGKGGAERYAADLSIALQKAGHTVRLVSFENRNAYSFLTDQLDYRYIHTYVQPSISSKHIYHTDEFDAMVAEFKPDIIHSHLFKAEIASRNTIFPYVTYVTTWHNNMPEFQNWQWSDSAKKITYTRLYEKRWMVKKYRECQNNFIAISEDTLHFYNRSLPKDLARNVSLNYNAIDFQKFNLRNHDRTSAFEAIRMIYTARFVPIKNHIFLIDVVDELRKRNLPVNLVLLGEGAEMDAVKKRIQTLRVEEHVQLLGNVDNVEDYLADANFYVHPAKYEPFGLVIIEAMASGLPPICLNGKGNADLIQNGINGYMLDEVDHKAFADVIVQLFKDKEKYRELADNAVAYARNFDIHLHAANMIEYYHRCIGKRTKNRY